MNTWQRFSRDFKLAIVGLQEALIAIADHVHQYVQKVKMNLEAGELGKEIKNKHIALGEQIYARTDLQLDQLSQEPDMLDLMNKIETTQRKLEAIEGVVSPYEALHDFERLLIRSDFVIQHVIVVDGFHGIGKSIKELAFPSQMLIFFIKKRNQQIEIAFGKVVIDSRDEITFLCSKENIQKYMALWK